ncbi:hypothetical protein Tco_0303138 [Tanacetum coccineum]
MFITRNELQGVSYEIRCVLDLYCSSGLLKIDFRSQGIEIFRVSLSIVAAGVIFKTLGKESFATALIRIRISGIVTLIVWTLMMIGKISEVVIMLLFKHGYYCLTKVNIVKCCSSWMVLHGIRYYCWLVIRTVLMVDSNTFGQEMVNILVSGEEYDIVFNHLDMLHAPLEGKVLIFTTTKSLLLLPLLDYDKKGEDVTKMILFATYLVWWHGMEQDVEDFIVLKKFQQVQRKSQVKGKFVSFMEDQDFCFTSTNRG